MQGIGSKKSKDDETRKVVYKSPVHLLEWVGVVCLRLFWRLLLVDDTEIHSGAAPRFLLYSKIRVGVRV